MYFEQENTSLSLCDNETVPLAVADGVFQYALKVALPFEAIR